jgi:siroheme synthase-like protein
MAALTLNIKTDNKLSVVVGGGAVALRKIQTLLTAGSSVSVVALSVCPEISELKNSGAVELKLGSYITSDLDNAFLVVAATNDESVNKRVCNDAMERRILVAS